MARQIEYKFTLPKGYVDKEGTLHINGVMKLATVEDEILSQEDPRVQCTPEYLKIILLSKVVIRLGSLNDINNEVIEGLFLEDFFYLKEFYQKINGNIMGSILKSTEEFIEDDKENHEIVLIRNTAISSDQSDGEIEIVPITNPERNAVFVIGGKTRVEVEKAIENYVRRHNIPE